MVCVLMESSYSEVLMYHVTNVTYIDNINLTNVICQENGLRLWRN